MKKISILIPTYNEVENVEPLSQAIIEEFAKSLPQYDYEIVFIDNYSKDGTRDKLRMLCKGNKKIKAIFNSKNFGQFNSPYHGLFQTTGDCTITLCADFQDPVEVIPQFVKEWENGSKIVIGKKNKSKENKIVRLGRTIYYKLIKKLSSVPQIEHFTGFGLYDKSFLDSIKDLDDPTPYFRGIVAELGPEYKTVYYQQQKRKAGKTKNNFKTLFDAAMLGFTTYTKLPRVFFILSAFLTAFTFLGAIALLILTINLGLDPVYLMASVIGCLCFFNMSVLGLVAEYIMSINTRSLNRPHVIEEERINFDD